MMRKIANGIKIRTPGNNQTKIGVLFFYLFLVGLFIGIGTIFADEIFKPAITIFVNFIKGFFGGGA